ncbi:MAG: hypothetical protein AAFR11_06410 [Pseudomonadota bacterium]
MPAHLAAFATLKHVEPPILFVDPDKDIVLAEIDDDAQTAFEFDEEHPLSGPAATD